MSADQLRADLFELGQLSRAVGLDPAKVGPHVAMIRRDAEALLGDPAVATLAAEVIRACESVMSGSVIMGRSKSPVTAPPPEPTPLPDRDRVVRRSATPVAPPLRVEPVVVSPRKPAFEPGRVRIGLTSGDRHWVWHFPEDVDRLRREWTEGYLPVQLVVGIDSFRGILGVLEPVDTLGDTDLRATLSELDCVLHLPEGDLRWRLRIHVGLLRDGEHLSTWRFPFGTARLLEEWRAGRAPLQDMPPPRAYLKRFVGEVGPATGSEAAWVHLAPGHETRLTLDGQDHPLQAPLDLPEVSRVPPAGPVLHPLRKLSHFSAGDVHEADAAGFDGEDLVRLAVRALPAAALVGVGLARVEELVVGPVPPEVIDVLLAGKLDRLRVLVLSVEAPALVAHAPRLTCLHLLGVPVPLLPVTLQELHVTGPVDPAALSASARSCRDLRRVVLRNHGLADFAGVEGPWILDVGRLPGQVLGLDDELRHLRMPWEDLDPILDRWMVRLWTDVRRIVALEGVALSWRKPASARDGAAEGPGALRACAARGALAGLLQGYAGVLDTVDQGFDGAFGNDFDVWMCPLSAAVVEAAALARSWVPGRPPPLGAGDPLERARQVAEFGGR